MSTIAELIAIHYGAVLAVSHAALAGATVGHVLLFKTDSRAAFGWIGLIVVFPVAGIALYLIFGINRVRRKAQPANSTLALWTEQGSLPELRAPAPPAMTALESIGWRVTGQALRTGNAVEALFNGEEAYPSMLQAIAGAAQEILLSTYIFDNDATGAVFVDACAAARRRGVRVCVLLDDIGRRYSWPSILPRLRRDDIEVRRFMPLRLLPPSLSMNLRNHRKLLVIDGAVAFAGGMNIGDRQLAGSDSPRRASDLHFRFTGPVVADLRGVFADDWVQMGGQALTPLPAGDEPSAGDSRCRVVPDGPDERLDHLAMLIEGTVSAARERVSIVTPYFLPHKTLVGALQSAALRGADVTVVIPARNNWPFVRWALNHNLWELLRAGIRVYEQPPPFAHAKCLLIDQDYALVGSTNLDPRSLRLNFELGIEIFDSPLNRVLHDYVRATVQRSAPVTRRAMTGRGIPARLRDAVAALMSPYL